MKTNECIHSFWLLCIDIMLGSIISACEILAGGGLSNCSPESLLAALLLKLEKDHWQMDTSQVVWY